jgi:hypothetical protein
MVAAVVELGHMAQFGSDRAHENDEANVGATGAGLPIFNIGSFL